MGRVQKTGPSFDLIAAARRGDEYRCAVLHLANDGARSNS